MTASVNQPLLSDTPQEYNVALASFGPPTPPPVELPSLEVSPKVISECVSCQSEESAETTLKVMLLLL